MALALRFTWDSTKAASNLRKHRVAFDLAACVFSDPFALVEQDRIEDGELRWRTLGLVGDVVVLMVAQTIRDEADGTETIRIISARKAERHERRRYEQARWRDL